MGRERNYVLLARAAKELGKITWAYNAVMVYMFVWGVLALVGTEDPTAVSEQSSIGWYTIWLLWHVICPPFIWVGQFTSNRKVGWLLRFAGDGGLCIMIGTHAVALHQQPDTTYWLYMMAGIGTVMLGVTIRDLIERILLCSRFMP